MPVATPCPNFGKGVPSTKLSLALPWPMIPRCSSLSSAKSCDWPHAARASPATAASVAVLSRCGAGGAASSLVRPLLVELVEALHQLGVPRLLGYGVAGDKGDGALTALDHQLSPEQRL